MALKSMCILNVRIPSCSESNENYQKDDVAPQMVGVDIRPTALWALRGYVSMTLMVDIEIYAQFYVQAGTSM
jgi:hypothetical protein